MTRKISRFRQIMITLIMVSIFILFLAIIVFIIAPPPMTSTLSDSASVPYHPATFGIPEIVAGYRIFTVQTAQNTACMPPDEMRLIVQAVDPSPDNPMFSREGGDLVAELEKLKPDIKLGLEFIMPISLQREQFVIQHIQRNEAAKKNGCLQLGGPIPTITDLPDPSP